MKKYRSGFTLAEVLITLVIIGIIAAMTIPSLMNKTNEQETVVAVKKAYSSLSQAYQRIIAENGEINSSYFGLGSVEKTKNFADMFVTYLNIQKDCGMSSSGDCWSTENGGIYTSFDGSNWNNWNLSASYYKIRLADGISVGFSVFEENRIVGTSELTQNVIGDLFIDVNGDKGPNRLGKDVFAFWISKYGVVPEGMPDDTFTQLSKCRSSGGACTAWIIQKGNMDYLRKDISW